MKRILKKALPMLLTLAIAGVWGCVSQQQTGDFSKNSLEQPAVGIDETRKLGAGFVPNAQEKVAFQRMFFGNPCFRFDSTAPTGTLRFVTRESGFFVLKTTAWTGLLQPSEAIVQSLAAAGTWMEFFLPDSLRGKEIELQLWENSARENLLCNTVTTR